MLRTRPHRLTLVAVLAALTAVASGLQASDSSQAARIIWKKAFDGGIVHREYFGGWTSEPNVGISPDTTRATPVRMVASSKGVYILDAAGHVERLVSVRREPWPKGRDPKSEPMEITNEYALTAPNGEFYVILENTSDGLTAWVDRLRVFNVDGSRRFEISASRSRFLGAVNGLSHFIAPNSDYIVVFHSDFRYLYFYDARTGRLIHYVDDNFFRTMRFGAGGLRFSDDGTRVILSGSFKNDDLLEFNNKGRFLRRIEGGFTSREAERRQAREAVKRMLEPKAVEDLLARGYHLGHIANFGLLRDRPHLGTYARGDTLCLFELTGRESKE
ncbi:MAG: hypothetical protein OXG13_09830 [Gemmatimonadaceae bacterium]|nr:hypothetical protein [Gemmatimonadaceae bacterium]